MWTSLKWKLEHLLRYTDSSEGRSPEITITCKIEIVTIPKEYILYLVDQTNLIVKYWKNQEVNNHFGDWLDLTLC